MHRYFGPKGLLAGKVKNFEFRASQLEMAEAVYRSLRNRTPLLVEAGTGTGKTWAYLVPALLSGQRVVVSTGTKNLQDQLLDSDIPLLAKLLFPAMKVVCLKGRKNYLCRRKFRDFSYQPTFWNKKEAALFSRFQKWAQRTKTGDRAEVPWLPDESPTWNEVSSSSDQCLGQQCRDYGLCFLTQLRSEASMANLIVVNHHLFSADLALRCKGIGEILPDYDAVVFDEAHQLEDIIPRYFGFEFSNMKVGTLARDILRESPKKVENAENLQAILGAAQQLEVLSRKMYPTFAGPGGKKGRFSLDPAKMSTEFVQTCNEMIHAFGQLREHLSSLVSSDPVFESFDRRILELSTVVEKTLAQEDQDLVYWVELTDRNISFHATPFEIGDTCRSGLFGQSRAIVLTSATLSVAGSCEFLRSSLGMPAETEELLLPSPFDYRKQGMIYIPGKMPLPSESRFCDAVATEAIQILRRTKGRGLFLFTSYRHLNKVLQKLENRLPFPVLVQGQKPKRRLLAEFKEKVDSVLLATSSFWQGIDVPGEALSCLLIDKLPFEVPDDPLIAARMDHLSKQGRNPFFQLQVPRAIIQLKQGIGRLIRSSTDLGVFVIFDTRILKKSYGKLFLDSLPPCRITHDLQDIDLFFRRL